ncbi:MAG: CTP synthase, partial [Erysipelotrichaceae bacterium]|nr:CTP synthase [Erysipelotrichaceae bacterium]
WIELTNRICSLEKKVTIALVGKYIKLHDEYLSVIEALKHGGYENNSKVSIKWIDSETITQQNCDSLFSDVDGIIVPGGFGDRGIEGMIITAKYCRENNVPYFGICLGMQIAAIEFARNVLGYKDANSNEFDSSSAHKIIDFMADQNDEIDKGGTMRLGGYPCKVKENSLLQKCYNKQLVSERHRHRYEFNNDYRNEFIENGMDIVGTSPDDKLVEAISYIKNDFFIGVQYHPEFKSRPNKAHPIFREFIKYSLQNKESQ